MARGLATLLGRKDDKLFLLTINDLEKATGLRGVDAHLIGDILHRGHEIIRALKLDGSDSTAQELYNSLRALPDKELLSDTAYVGVIVDKECISFNASDLRDDIERDVAFRKRSLRHIRGALLEEIRHRYEAVSSKDSRVVTRLIKSL